MNMKLLVGAGVLLVLGAFGAGYYGGAPSSAPSVTSTAPAARAQGGALPALTTLPAPSPAMAPAPWAGAGMASAPPVAAPALPANLDPAVRQKLERIQADLAIAMRDGKKVDSRQVDAALLAIKQAAGTPLVGGINLDAVRANLAVAEQIQAVAQEVQREVQKGGPVDSKRMNAYAAQLQKLQAQLQTDVRAPGPAAQ